MTKMRARFLGTATIIFSMALQPGCSGTISQIDLEESYSHGRVEADTRSKFHAEFLNLIQLGRMYLYISQKGDSPRPIIAKRINAKIVLPDGAEKDVFFDAAPVPKRRIRRSATNMYVLTEDWIPATYNFSIQFFIPIRGEVYPVGYIYSTKGIDSFRLSNAHP